MRFNWLLIFLGGLMLLFTFLDLLWGNGLSYLQLGLGIALLSFGINRRRGVS